MKEVNPCPHCGKDLDAHVIQITKYGCPRDEARAGKLLFWMLIFSMVLATMLLIASV